MTSPLRSIAVFCGSSMGNDPAYAQAARDLGKEIARRNIKLVYGGGHVGLMGVVADAALGAGGIVHGVIPQSLHDKEVGHKGLTHLDIVDSMHQRKARMAELSGGFIAMPGGIGTFEEIFEVWTWAQLGYHDKPVGFLNVAGYYDALIGFLDASVTTGFVRPGHRAMVAVETDSDALLGKFETYVAPQVVKWVSEGQT
jgi:uncharacterized protein (TIGR00730 family)